MVNALLQGILKTITTIINVILSPINLLVSSLFPDFSQMISNFNTFVNRFLGASLGYFISMFPPIFRTLVIFTLGFLVSYCTFTVTYSALVHIFNIIKRIKFW